MKPHNDLMMMKAVVISSADVIKCCPDPQVDQIRPHTPSPSKAHSEDADAITSNNSLTGETILGTQGNKPWWTIQRHPKMTCCLHKKQAEPQQYCEQLGMNDDLHVTDNDPGEWPPSQIPVAARYLYTALLNHHGPVLTSLAK